MVKLNYIFPIHFQCLQMIPGTVIVIDDAHNIDSFSWQFFCELLSVPHCLIVLGIRPSLLDSPSCREVVDFIDHRTVQLVDLGGLNRKYTAPLACQLMSVDSITKDLDMYELIKKNFHL